MEMYCCSCGLAYESLAYLDEFRCPGCWSEDVVVDYGVYEDDEQDYLD